MDGFKMVQYRKYVLTKQYVGKNNKQEIIKSVL